MGEYIYKVTAKKKILSDGKEANIAVFAYKPTWGFSFDGKSADDLNRSMAWKAKCHISEKYVRESKNYSGRVVLGETGEIAIPVNRGTFSDYWFDNQVEKLHKRVNE